MFVHSGERTDRAIVREFVGEVCQPLLGILDMMEYAEAADVVELKIERKQFHQIRLLEVNIDVVGFRYLLSDFKRCVAKIDCVKLKVWERNCTSGNDMTGAAACFQILAGRCAVFCVFIGCFGLCRNAVRRVWIVPLELFYIF